MDLETLLFRVNSDRYAVVDEFVDDFECVLASALEYNEPGSAIVHKAQDLFDTFMTYINTLKKREPEFVWELKQSALRRKLIDQQRRKDGLAPLFERTQRMRDGMLRRDGRRRLKRMVMRTWLLLMTMIRRLGRWNRWCWTRMRRLLFRLR
ncbi:hypothetical protein BC829DRAFT_166004 [Chytridium lagenaria]|nr:hypothetical protein BC829DRAFT_166004 [Chytridium lagenaria]